MKSVAMGPGLALGMAFYALMKSSAPPGTGICHGQKQESLAVRMR